MTGDVRATFDLNDRPATAAMGRLRREGEELDLVLTKLGETVDSIFSEKNVAEVKNYELALASLDRQARQSFNSISRNAKEAEFQTVGSIHRMDSSVALFRENLDRLDHARATPTVDLDGIADAVAQVELLEKRLNALGRRSANPRVGIPGGTFSGPVASAVTPSPSTTNSSSFWRGGVKVPFAGSIPLPLIAGAVAAAPPLIGATTAVGGSLGEAALGAGTLGIGAAGVGAAAIGMTAPIAISSIAGMKEAAKALASYQQEVIKSGVNSEAARQKYRLYNMELRNAPAGTGRLLHAKTELVEDFKGATKPAQAGFTGILTRGVNLGRQLTPLYAKEANRFFGEGQQQTGQFANFLNSGSSRDFYKAMGTEATAALGPTENIAENVTATLMNLSRAARPFFHEGLVFLDQWTGGWKTSSKDVGAVRDDMRGWVGELKTWGKLTGATFDLLKDLGGAGAGSGQSLVGDLTHQLEVWDHFVQDNPKQVRNFFHESVDSTERLAEAVGKIFHLVWQIGQQLAPLLTQFAELVSLAGNAGLLTPGGLPLLLAGGAGIRAATRGLGGRITGTAAGTAGTAGVGAPLIIGGGGAAAGVSATARLFDRETYGLARSFGRGRVASTIAGLGASGTAERGAMFGRGFLGRLGPYALLAGGLGAASFQGNAVERVQAGLSSTTLGLIPAPKTGSEKEDIGLRHAGMVASFQAKRFGNDPQGLERQLLGLKRKIHSLGIPTHAEGLLGFLTEDITGGGGATEISEQARVEAEALRKRRKEIATGSLPATALSDLTGAFGVRQAHLPGRKKGESVSEFGERRAADTKANYQRTLDAIEHRVDSLHGSTKRAFAQMGLDWANELAKSNPKLKRAYEKVAEGIEERMRETGAKVAVINGNIVDVSAKSWESVADQIGTSTQRAYSEANENLTALEQRALTILRNMGYSKTQAQSLMHEAQTGKPTKAGSASNMEAHHHGQPGATINNMGPKKGRQFSGGRLPVPANGSLHDDVYLGNDQWGAGGELTVNRHTESRVNRVLRLAGTSLGREVAHEQRAHSQAPVHEYNAALGGRFSRRFATGGILPAATLAEKMGMGVSGGPGPGGGIPSSGHVGDSLHYSGLAYDVTGSAAQMRRYFLAAWKDFHGSINELFYDPMGYYYDQGQKVAGAIGGHSDHVHIGFFPSGAHTARGVRGLGGFRGGGGRGTQEVHLHGMGSKRGGVPGAAVAGASSLEAAGLSKNLNKILARHSGGRGVGGGFAAPGGSRSAVERQIAQVLFSRGANKIGAAGIIGNAYRESGMDPGAEGTGGGGLWGFTSGAISLANLKKAGGSHWESPQFQTGFMLAHGGQGLIPTLNRAGSPEEAARIFMEQWERPGILATGDREAGARVAFSQGFGRGGRARGFAGWFADGGRGRVHGPTLIGLGENGPEDFEITPAPRRGRAGRRGGMVAPVVHVNMGGVTIASGEDAQKVGERIGRHAAKALTEALAESDEVSDEALIGV